MTQCPTAREGAAAELRASKRRLRTATQLLEQTERFLHDLPDRQCPVALLDAIRRFNSAKGDMP
ncbi:hypothetical protein [Pseudoxanthomonas sp. USHLN014]|uniref:hypothetical protein n=1 Tax=Pseudoxanthomonas sp. USHLN014 TaxID=3081297 RepID=UPI00301E2E97